MCFNLVSEIIKQGSVKMVKKIMKLTSICTIYRPLQWQCLFVSSLFGKLNTYWTDFLLGMRHLDASLLTLQQYLNQTEVLKVSSLGVQYISTAQRKLNIISFLCVYFIHLYQCQLAFIRVSGCPKSMFFVILYSDPKSHDNLTNIAVHKNRF